MKRNIAYLFAIGLIFVGLLVFRNIFPSPRTTFERSVVKLIPASVQAIELGSARAMDSAFWALHFEINRTDLQKLLDSQRFIPIDEAEELRRWDQSVNDYVRISREEYFKLWEQRIRNAAKLNVNLSKDWQACALKETGGKKYIFSNPSSTEAVFIAEAH